MIILDVVIILQVVQHPLPHPHHQHHLYHLHRHRLPILHTHRFTVQRRLGQFIPDTVLVVAATVHTDTDQSTLYIKAIPNARIIIQAIPRRIVVAIDILSKYPPKADPIVVMEVMGEVARPLTVSGLLPLVDRGATLIAVDRSVPVANTMVVVIAPAPMVRTNQVQEKEVHTMNITPDPLVLPVVLRATRMVIEDLTTRGTMTIANRGEYLPLLIVCEQKPFVKDNMI